jgi:hypothetical protein
VIAAISPESLPLAGLARFCQTSRPRLAGAKNVSLRSGYSNRSLLAVAAIALSLLSTAGCALFHKESWNPNRYRDERAVDIDRRLERNTPIVKNPF